MYVICPYLSLLSISTNNDLLYINQLGVWFCFDLEAKIFPQYIDFSSLKSHVIRLKTFR